MVRLNGMIDVKFINNTFFKNIKYPVDINNGRCFQWAYIAYRLYSNLEIWDMGSHAFVRSKVDHKFYDAERPDGEIDWRDLPATMNGFGCGCVICQQPPVHYKTLGYFRRHWLEMERIHSVNYNELSKKINETILENI